MKVRNLGYYTLTRNFVIVRFQVLKATGRRMTAFWVIAPCRLVEAHLHHQGYVSSVYLNETTQCHIPDGGHLQQTQVS
jgi:hypothetical protein